MRTTLRHAVRRAAFALRPGGTKSDGSLARLMSAIAVGTFSEAELVEARTRHWAYFAEEHPSRKNGLFAWETRCYEPYLRPGVRLLVVGAGSGRDVLCFLRDGCVVTAIDESAASLDALERRLQRAGLQAEVVAAAIADFETATRFDVVIFSWLAYILMPTQALRLASLRRAAAVLRPGGVLILSYKPGQGSPALGRVSRAVARVVGGAPPEDFEDFVCDGTSREPRIYHSRFFTAAEIEDEARLAGLRVVDHHHGRAGWDDPGWIVLSLPR